MTAFLLDTNALLLLGNQPGAVPGPVREALTQGIRFVSQICAVEIAIKFNIGKLALPPPFETSFAHAFSEMVRQLSAEVLPLELTHIDTLRHLPLHHRDPFDRLIISQALTEGLTVVTNDRAFVLYPGLMILEF